MTKRMILMLLVVGALLATIGFTKYRQVQAAVAQASSFQPPPEAVTTIVAQEETWRPNLHAIGTVTPVNGVTVSADLPGVVERIAFDSGRRVRQGDLLVQLDTRQETALLAAAVARRDLAVLNLKRIGGLLEKGVASRAENDAAVAQHDQSEAEAAAIRATIARKTIRAPFSGLLGLRQVNLGQYLDSGDPIVSLQSLDPIHVDFGLPQQELSRASVGRELNVTAEDAGEALKGTITAVESVVDAATRNVQVQATLANPGDRLRPGMFVTVDLLLEATRPIVAIPASSVSYAPFGDSIFIVEQVKGPGGQQYLGARQQFVKLGQARGDQVAVLSGLKPGEVVVTSGVFKLRNGAAVQVNNEVQPGNDPAPKPEDN